MADRWRYPPASKPVVMGELATLVAVSVKLDQSKRTLTGIGYDSGEGPLALDM